MGCANGKEAGNLMCITHWHAVPKPLQDAVWRAFKNWERNKKNMVMLRALKSAQQQAINSVKS